MSALADQVAKACADARAASRRLAVCSRDEVDHALEAVAQALELRAAEIQEANARDVAAAEAAGTSGAMLQRLRLTDKVFAQMVEGVRQVASLSSPVGEEISRWERPNGLRLRKVRVPIGVIAIIYESRPNVTVDAAVLCLKAGNAVVLRGGSEAAASNAALARAVRAGLEKAGLPADALQMIATTDREAVTHLCHQDATVDLIIPRGGEGLIRTVVREARMPVIKHYNGICHAYVHAAADPAMAAAIVVNGKCQKPGVCNALETVLVDAAVAPTMVPRLARELRERGVEIRGDAAVCELANGQAVPAPPEAWTTEYLDLVVNMAVVDGVAAAVRHINTFGSHHSDAIITADEAAAHQFLAEVDSAAVFWNASTRFSDGYEFGFGAEIGISTDKLHARGPMGLAELTSYKYVIEGQGQVRA